MKKQTTGVYLIKNAKILFLIRNKKNDKMHHSGVFLPIGGHVELGEGIEEAAKREVKEESGITVHSLKLKGIVYIRNQNSGDYDVIMFLFTSSKFMGEPIDGPEGKFEWVDKNKLLEINLYEGDRIFLELLQKNDFFIVELLYKNFDLVDHKILKLL